MDNQLLHELRSETRCEELTVTRNTISMVENNESNGKNAGSGRECASYAPTDSELANALGAGFEYFSLLRPPLWPFTSIRLFQQEEE